MQFAKWYLFIPGPLLISDRMNEKMEKLLTRDEFRESVFRRDNHKCVICGVSGVPLDAHHIIERRLFSDYGYYLSNGASLCGEHHIQAETTELDCETIREAAGITSIVIPEGWYPDQRYSKWGDVILPNGQRMKGELFDDDSVQKILKAGPNFGLYTNYVKYPRTWHLPWSQGQTKDDRTLENCSQFEGQEVIVTEKMDGENTTMYRDYIHARSIDGRNHWSRDWVKNLQGRVGWEIPDGWRLCGENLMAEHSIAYEGLQSYFLLFSIWNDRNECLDWDEMVDYADILGLTTVPVLYRGIWDEDKVKSLFSDKDRDKIEGYVVRLVRGFHYGEFSKSLAKFVRKDHVNPANHHWMHTATKKNGLDQG